MGCDIHIVLQKKVDEHWLNVDLGRDERGWAREIYEGRCYVLFGILAGVRNYDVVPIAEPRGIPEDLPLYNGESERYLGDHSYSWLGLREMLYYDWSQQLEGESYRELVGSFYTESLEKMKELAGDDFDSIRMVFGFDS